MSQTVIGIFDYTSEAQEAVNYLVNNGFGREDIDLSSRGAGTEGTTASHDNNTYTDNSIGGFFSNLFGSGEETDRYTEVGGKGAIVTVHAKTSEEAQAAVKVLDNYGALDVNERSTQYRASSETPKTGGGETIKVIEEKMQVGKREVETGGVRLRSRIVEKAVHEDVRLRTERVRVEHTNVGRPATEADLANFKDSTLEMKEYAEVPVVGKEAFVTGEVSLEKEVQEKDETVQGTVRKTEVDTEDFTGQAGKTKTEGGDSGNFYK